MTILLTTPLHAHKVSVYRFTENRGNSKISYTYHLPEDVNLAYRDNCLKIEPLFLIDDILPTHVSELPPTPNPASVSVLQGDPGETELRDNYTLKQMQDYALLALAQRPSISTDDNEICDNQTLKQRREYAELVLSTHSKTFPPALPTDTAFSKFIREASPEEKKDVYEDVVLNAIHRQQGQSPEISSLRKDLAILSVVAFSLMVESCPEDLPEDAPALAVESEKLITKIFPDLDISTSKAGSMQISTIIFKCLREAIAHSKLEPQ